MGFWRRLFGIENSNIVDVGSPDKNPLDHVIFDSAIELITISLSLGNI